MTGTLPRNHAESGHPPEWGEPHTKTTTWFWPEELRQQLMGVSGLELVRGIADGRYPPPPIMSLFPARFVSVEKGEVRLVCAPDRSFLNPNGAVHGGFLCTLMDTAIGCAVITESSPANPYATIELKVSFFRPLPTDGREVEVRGSTQRIGRRVAFAEAHAYDADRNLLGHATSSLAAVVAGA
jgi:uncharacterized protein (TIGR00369 family)